MIEHGLSPQLAERSPRQQCFFCVRCSKRSRFCGNGRCFCRCRCNWAGVGRSRFAFDSRFRRRRCCPQDKVRRPGGRNARCGARDRIYALGQVRLWRRGDCRALVRFSSSEGSPAGVSAGRSAAAVTAAGFASVCADASDVRHSLGADASGSSKAPWSVGAAASALKASATAEDIGAS